MLTRTLLALMLAPLAAHAAPDEPGGFASTHVIVRVAPGLRPGPVTVGHARADAALAASGARSITPVFPGPFGDPELAARLGLDRYYQVELPPGSDTPRIAANLALVRDVFDSAEPDPIGQAADIPDDPEFGHLWGLRNIGFPGDESVPDADIDADLAWAISTGGDDVVLAILDSGISHHIDLGAKVLLGYNAGDGTTNTVDECGHGTHVAGTAGAIGNNGVGIAGVSWGVRILPIKVLTKWCTGGEGVLSKGLVYAADSGADIANMSLQFYSGTQLLADAVAYADQRGVLLIAAAGNNKGAKVAYPAKFPQVVAISATNAADHLAGFSNYGPEIDLAAPGEEIWSLKGADEYQYNSGTSMAAPHIAGLASLIWSMNPALDNREVEAILEQTAEDLGQPGKDSSFGLGRINAYRAALAAMPCYADADGDGSLTISDFVTFQTLFAAGDLRANCTGDLTPLDQPILDVDDFVCFQTAFSQGCP